MGIHKRYEAERWPTFLDDAHAEPGCRDTDAETFFDPWTEDAAKRVCAACPLLAECRDWAESRPYLEVWGIWGGTNQDERRRARARAADRAKKAAARLTPAEENERLANCTHDELPPLAGETCSVCGADLGRLEDAA